MPRLHLKMSAVVRCVCAMVICAAPLSGPILASAAGFSSTCTGSYNVTGTGATFGPTTNSGGSSASLTAADNDGFAAIDCFASPGNLGSEIMATGNQSGNTSAIANAQFTDTLTVTGTSGMATFTMGFTINSTLSPGTGGGNAGVNAVLSANGQNANGSQVYDVFLVNPPGSSTPTVQPPFSITVPVGSTIQLMGHVQTDGVGVANGTTSSADALDPMDVFIQSLTPGDDYTADSGVRYPSSPVPEPSTLLLLGSGIPGTLGGMLSRRRRRAPAR